MVWKHATKYFLFNDHDTGKKSKGSPKGKNHILENFHRTAITEVNVVLLTNSLMRGQYLGERLSENVQYLGFWEHICLNSFKTLGCRMTALSRPEVEELFNNLGLDISEHKVMVSCY